MDSSNKRRKRSWNIKQEILCFTTWYIKHERPCLTTFRNTEMIVENTKRCGVRLFTVTYFFHEIENIDRWVTGRHLGLLMGAKLGRLQNSHIGTGGGVNSPPCPPSPLPTGILYSPHFRSHQYTKMAARRTQRWTCHLWSQGKIGEYF